MSDKPSVKLLQDEYKYFSESFWKNEETGEKRVQFFIGLVTAVLGALGALASSFSHNDSRMSDKAFLAICFFSLLGLLGIGIVTLARILKRNRVTDEYKEALDSIRALYMERLDKEEGILHGYEPLKKSKPAARRKFGGLANLVEMLNSIVVAGIAASVVLGTRAFTGHRLDDFAAKLAGAAALFFMIAAFIAQYLLTDRLTHAGGVVYKIEEGPKFLIVKSSKDPSQWVLPKGHIRHGTMESARRAAIREVKEETGCTAKIVRKIGVSEYRFENENLRIMFFLMRLDEGKPRIKAEERDIKWLGREEAVATLQFEDSKKLVTAAAEYIESQGIGNRASR